MQACAVIADFTEKGEIIPRRFRVREGNEYLTMNVTGYMMLPKTFDSKGVRKYRCKIEANETVKECELWFYIDTMKWVLARM